MPRPYVIDLFSGVGGFSLGAYMAGFQAALAVEIDHDLTYGYSANFPHTPLLLADVRGISSKEVVERACCDKEEIAGIIGGPPCQGFSPIGRRDPDDSRNLLVGEYFRIVAEILPRFFVMENVPGLLAGTNARLVNDPLRRLKSRYHITGPLVLDAADFGSATRRRRAIVIGVKRTAGSALTLQEIRRLSTRPLTVADVLETLPPLDGARPDGEGEYWAAYSEDLNSRQLSPFLKWATACPPALLGSRELRRLHRSGIVSGFQPTNHSERVRRRFERVPPGEVDGVSKYPRLRWDAPAPTLRAGTGRDRGCYQAARPIHPTENRVIAVREAARIQGFPDWFRFHPTKWHSFRMLGNSVSPLFARCLLRALRAKLRSAT